MKIVGKPRVRNVPGPRTSRTWSVGSERDAMRTKRSTRLKAADDAQVNPNPSILALAPYGRDGHMLRVPPRI